MSSRAFSFHQKQKRDGQMNVGVMRGATHAHHHAIRYFTEVVMKAVNRYFRFFTGIEEFKELVKSINAMESNRVSMARAGMCVALCEAGHSYEMIKHRTDELRIALKAVGLKTKTDEHAINGLTKEPYFVLVRDLTDVPVKASSFTV